MRFLLTFCLLLIVGECYGEQTSSHPGGALDQFLSAEPDYGYIKPVPMRKVSVSTPKKVAVVVSGAYYPVRGSWWTGCSGWQHLTHGEHAGKFDRDWLRSLSYAEVQSLHSDDHEGRVKWVYARRPGQYTSTVVQTQQTLVTVYPRFTPVEYSVIAPVPMSKKEERQIKKAQKELGRVIYGTRDGKHPGPVGAWLRGWAGDPRYRSYSCPSGNCPYN